MSQRYQYYSFSGKSENCYGLTVVCQNLWQMGVECIPYDETEKDDILLSCYWPEQIFDIIRFRYTNPNKGRRIIVGGNTPTTNPAMFIDHADHIFLGDGEKWDGTLDHENMVSKDTTSPAEKAVADRLNPVAYMDTQVTKRSFVEISRGCKNCCFFCQYGWLKKYKEARFEDIMSAINEAETKTIRLFAADRFQHTQYLRIRREMDRKGKCDSGSDASLKFMKRHKHYYNYTRKIRAGIEGMSERLRWLVNKPISDDDLVESVVEAYAAGIRSIDWYMIYGIPGERAEDVDCFKELLRKINDAVSERVVIALHWNAFTPSAQTPLQWAAPAYRYEHAIKLRQLASNENRLSKLVVYHKPLLTSDLTLLSRILSIRLGRNAGKLLYTLAKNKSLLKNKPEAVIKKANELAGIDIMGEWPVDKPFPWDDYVKYSRPRMERIWDRYQRRMKQ